MTPHDRGYLQSTAEEALNVLIEVAKNKDERVDFLRGLIAGVQSREAEKIANFVETSKRFDNVSLARDVRGRKYAT